MPDIFKTFAYSELSTNLLLLLYPLLSVELNCYIQFSATP